MAKLRRSRNIQFSNAMTGEILRGENDRDELYRSQSDSP